MTYRCFLAVFVLPQIGILLLLCLWKPSSLPRTRLGLALMALLALLYTTPWDNYLLYRGVWSYPKDRVLESLRFGFVPLEEYAFILLQPIFTGLFLLVWAARHETQLTPLALPARTTPLVVALGLSFAALLMLVGAMALRTSAHGLYLGLILLWAAPILGLQWAWGAARLAQMRGFLATVTLAPALYFCIADRLAIGRGIWTLSPSTCTGWNLLGLPVEEALFFLVTNLLITQGLLLFFAAAHRRVP